MNKITLRAIAIVIVVLLIDQFVKIWVKTHMLSGEELLIIGNWFRVHFVENAGMAFSIELPGQYGKLLLSTFRIIAIGGIIYLIRNMIKTNAHPGLIYCGSMILAGAVGNVLDSAFYGLVFTESYHNVAHFVPIGQGYAGFMEGHVVDMLWFPIIHGVFPDWLPVWGGEYFEFFRPVFNVADAAITTGVFIIILFQKRFFAEKEIEAANTDAGTDTETASPLNESKEEILTD
jgi:signal peptidase II